MRRGHLGTAAVAAAWLVAAGGASGQQGCQFVEGSGTMSRIDAGGGPITYVSTPNLVCADGVRIRADSAVSFQASNFVQLVGNVRFDDPERRLTARNAEYYTGAVGRLQAHGGSQLTQKTDSSVIRGDDMVYERAGNGRARSLLDVTGGRPTARLYMKSADSATAPRRDTAAAPYDITADHIVIEGDSYFRARGTVEIERDDMRAFGDSIEYDQVAGTLRITANARMLLEERVLTADEITTAFTGGDVREIEARHRAILTSEDLRLRAPVVRVYFTDGKMGRLVAVSIPPEAPEPGVLSPNTPSSRDPDRARPVATTDKFEIVGDSLDMLAPGEVLDRIHATGSARAESSTRDSLNTPETPALARTDWMEGDTIVAIFEDRAGDSTAAAAVADTASAPLQLESLTASGKARSLYRMAPNDSAQVRGEKRPAIHYVTATAITLQMDAGEVTRMDVVGETDGIHAEPARGSPPSAPATPPSAETPPPTTPGEQPDDAPPPDR